MAMQTDIVARGQKFAEKDVKNCWRWELTEKKIEDENVGRFIRKVRVSGVAYCILCRRKINYGCRGRVSLEDHMK